MENFWARYKRNHAAVFGLFVIVLIIVMAITASFLYPEDPFRFIYCFLDPRIEVN